MGEERENKNGLTGIERTALEKAELACYRIAYYLLAKEDAAVRATRSALCELLQDDKFVDGTEGFRDKLVKAAAIKASLGEKQQLLYKQARAGKAETAAAGSCDAARFPSRQTVR